MSRRFASLLIVLGTLYALPTSEAQQAAAANPLDAVPEKMPFDVPYGAPIVLERALAAIAAAANEARKHDW